jgi:hypothetical protein
VDDEVADEHPKSAAHAKTRTSADKTTRALLRESMGQWPPSTADRKTARELCGRVPRPVANCRAFYQYAALLIRSGTARSQKG